MATLWHYLDCVQVLLISILPPPLHEGEQAGLMSWVGQPSLALTPAVQGSDMVSAAPLRWKITLKGWGGGRSPGIKIKRFSFSVIAAGTWQEQGWTISHFTHTWSMQQNKQERWLSGTYETHISIASPTEVVVCSHCFVSQLQLMINQYKEQLGLAWSDYQVRRLSILGQANELGRRGQ